MRANIPDGDALYACAQKNGIQAVADLLREYVREGQPDDFCTGYTTRAMCRIASNGAEGKKDVGMDYMATKYGLELYWYMWGDGPLQKRRTPTNSGNS